MTLSANNIPTDRAAKLREQYRASLFDDVVPWWMQHSLDREHGGYYSLLERGLTGALIKYREMGHRGIVVVYEIETDNLKRVRIKVDDEDG